MYFHPKKEKFISKYTYQLLYNVLECGDNCGVQIEVQKCTSGLKSTESNPFTVMKCYLLCFLNNVDCKLAMTTEEPIINTCIQKYSVKLTH